MMQVAPIPAQTLFSEPQSEKSKPDDATDLLCPLSSTVDSYPSVEEQLESPVELALAALSTVDRLLITKHLNVKNLLFLQGKSNRFFVRTPDQNLIYTVEEYNSRWVGYFCFGLRPLQLRVFDAKGKEVMRVRRPFAWTARVLPCQLQCIQVFAPPATAIGTVEQRWTPLRPIYHVKNAEGETKYLVNGPRITLSCFQDVQFQIQRVDGSPVGATCKRWEGLGHAMFRAPVIDRFGVTFELNLGEEDKALLLAATLLLNYMYYDV
ncbi:hypothetical protein ACJJTC_007457 [Scirpophaga incertulas]